MTPGAADIGQLVGQLLAELDLRAKPAAAGPADELSELLAIPWRDWELDPTRRSSLTESGAPFELSVKLDGGQGISLRYVVDVADRRLDLSANAATYLTAVERTGQTAAAALFDRYLASTPVGAPARVMVGVGFAGGGRRRATVYFPASWLPVGTLGEMLPDGALGAAETEQAIVDPAVEVIGYDVVDGRLATCKTYRWLAVGPDLPMPVGVGDPAEGPAASSASSWSMSPQSFGRGLRFCSGPFVGTDRQHHRRSFSSSAAAGAGRVAPVSPGSSRSWSANWASTCAHWSRFARRPAGSGCRCTSVWWPSVARQFHRR